MISFKDVVETQTESIPSRLKRIGKIPKPQESHFLNGITFEDFLTYEEEARTVGPSDPEKGYYGTFDKKYGQYIFFENADPTVVQIAFHCGLIKMIILSESMNEIQKLDSNLVKVLKDFKRIVIKDQNLQMMLKINSTIPFWDKEGYLIKGYHHIQIKIVPEVFLERPIQGKVESTNEMIIRDWRNLSYQRILTGLKSFNNKSKIKINFSTDFILVTSKTGKTIQNEGIKILCNFEKNFYNLPNSPADHQGHLCKSLKQSLGKYHECKWCHLLEEKDKSPEESFWSTEGETSGGTESTTEKKSTESKTKEDGSD
ncbi:Hypothetical predicted protein [Olea europaea subsp. europaea]|uniref:Uncharacterized protein n=1 Tax=Olea europaea subsp. europaea TaxID=158383 RepID=A0A8S0TCZ1_OLEEU|nr:Hypothetical predicted protein [Olea europaea subsp. europaea]